MRKLHRIIALSLWAILLMGLYGCGCKHEWQDATCTEPKTCSKCGETEGEALGHTPGEWVQDDPDFVTSIVWIRQYCTVCGAELDTDIKALSSLHKDGTFLFSPKQFSDRLNLIFKTISNCTLESNPMSLSDGTMGTTIIDGSEHIGTILFIDSDSIMNTGTEDENSRIVTVICAFEVDDTEKQINSTLGIMMTCDPSLDVSEAADLGKKVILSAYTTDGIYENNGIKYLFGIHSDKSGRTQFVASVYEN